MLNLLNSFINFRTDNLYESLGILGMGMLAIFAVIGVIIIVTVLINKIFSGKSK